MVSSGSLWGNSVDGGEGSYLDWQRIAVDTVNNFSTISWQVGWRFVTTSCRGLRLGGCIINGATVYNDVDGGDGVHAYNAGHNHKPKLQTASGTLQIPHNADGTKQFSARVTMTGFSGKLSVGTTTWTMDSINRLPVAPSAPAYSDTRQTSTLVSFTPNSDGGTPITAYQLGYGLTSAADTSTISATSPQLVTGLLPARKYYFRVRAQNAVGWSAWSGITSVTTLAGARINVGGVFKTAVPYVRHAGVWEPAKPFVKHLGLWKEAQ